MKASRMNPLRLLHRQSSSEHGSGTDQTRCGACDRPLAEQGDLDPACREPCPHCGSTSRKFIRNLSETLELNDAIRVQQRRPGVSGGPILDAKHGDDLHRQSGKWYIVTQVKDRLNDLYVKTVWDPRRRRYTKYQKEPLSRHVPDSQKLPPGAIHRAWDTVRLWVLSQPRRWRS
jgi:hypothetical protein